MSFEKQQKVISLSTKINEKEVLPDTSINIQHFQTRVQEIEEEELLEELEETADSLEDIE